MTQSSTGNGRADRRQTVAEPLSATRRARATTINFPVRRTDAAADGPRRQTRPGPARPTPTDTCGTEFDERYNPSNTGNIRISSRFTLAHGLVLTVDAELPVRQGEWRRHGHWREGIRRSAAAAIRRSSAATDLGRDLNGDGDMLGVPARRVSGGLLRASPSRPFSRRARRSPIATA